MSQAAPATTAPSVAAPAPAAPLVDGVLPLSQDRSSYPDLLKQLVWLAFPVMCEHVLHMMVGLTDIYLASHLPGQGVPAAAAVGTVAYILWFIGMMAGAIGTGSTALIARAVGARHRSLANSVCGQSITTAALVGVGMAVLLYLGATHVARMTGLSGEAYELALFYLRVLCISLPFSTLMFAANACLRGAGDTVTPAVSMILVDGINLLLSASLARGWF